MTRSITGRTTLFHGDRKMESLSNTSTKQRRRFNMKITLGVLVLFGIMYNATQQPQPQEQFHYSTTTTTTTMMMIGHTSVHYTPSPVEQYIMMNLNELGYDTNEGNYSKGCAIWQKTTSSAAIKKKKKKKKKKKNHASTDDDTNAAAVVAAETSSIIYPDLISYLDKLKQYNKLVNQFKPLGVDLRTLLRNNEHNDNDDTITNQTTNAHHEEVCRMVDLNLQDLFSYDNNNKKKQQKQQQQQNHHHHLSKLTRTGYIEPLLPPLRHPKACLNYNSSWTEPNYMDPTYLVHDFGHVCRHHLQKHSRVVYFDLGASLQFHPGSHQKVSPVGVYLYHLYRKFGFHLDHIYAYEYTLIHPQKVYEQQLPPELMTSYHWINVGVNDTVGHALNPLTTILQHYTEDDVIIMKLDIDTPVLELSLAYQILHNSNLTKMIDYFYFEYHVHMEELRKNWKTSVRGSMKDSLQLFTTLRQKGIAAHSWV